MSEFLFIHRLARAAIRCQSRFSGNSDIRQLGLARKEFEKKFEEDLKHDISEQIKRIGVYYMCIDDLPL